MRWICPMNIQARLRMTENYIDPRFPKVWKQAINPDGFEAADFIDNTLDHIGHIVTLALRYVHDEDDRNEIRRRALAARKGLK